VKFDARRSVLSFPALLRYIYFMTIEKTVEIPADHRLTLEIPNTVPPGRARLEVIITPESARPKRAISLLDLRGSCKGEDTLEAYFKRKRADKALEDRTGPRQRGGSL
jgi:hypothetical protein